MNPRPDSPDRAAPVDARALPIGYRLNPDWEVTPRDAAALLGNHHPGFVLLDCRRDDEWALARINGAIHIPLNQVESRLDELETDEGLRDRQVVVYCHHGQRSLRAAAILRGAGFSNAVSMAGGIDAWSLAIDPSVARY